MWIIQYKKFCLQPAFLVSFVSSLPGMVPPQMVHEIIRGHANAKNKGTIKVALLQLLCTGLLVLHNVISMVNSLTSFS